MNDPQVNSGSQLMIEEIQGLKKKVSELELEIKVLHSHIDHHSCHMPTISYNNFPMVYPREPVQASTISYTQEQNNASIHYLPLSPSDSEPIKAYPKQSERVQHDIQYYHYHDQSPAYYAFPYHS
jgi:hypothetical protein